MDRGGVRRSRSPKPDHSGRDILPRQQRRVQGDRRREGAGGGFGVSGDGVDEDDAVTSGGIGTFDAPPAIRADQSFVSGVRLPYMKFTRNTLG